MLESAAASPATMGARDGSTARSTLHQDKMDDDLEKNAKSASSTRTDPVFSSFRRKDVTHKLEWRDIDYCVGKKHILKGISGEANPGEVVAIMGPSGCGKTTLLNILAGRIQARGNKKLRGTIALNGKNVRPRAYRRQVAYVTQEDALFATSTVREALEFSARLRLPANTLREDRERIVRDVIMLLGLTECEHTMFGNALIRGLSGGERKRCAIGVELMSNPSMLFLDEPTTGLDSWSALSVVNILKSIANTGCTVLCSIHQPSSEVFNSFESLLLLGAGTVIYQGSLADVDEPFNKMGITFPPRTNIADEIMLLVQTMPLDALPNNDKNSLPRTASFYNEPAVMADVGTTRTARDGKPGVLVQTQYLAVREFKSLYRDRTALVGRFLVVIVLHVLVALLFMGVANQTNPNYSFQSHFGALVILLFGAIVTAIQPAIMSFPFERPVFVRERASGTYTSVAYMLSKLVVEIPLAFSTTMLSLAIVYWAVGLRGEFMLLVLCLWALMLAAASIGIFISSAAATPESAQEIGPIALVPQLLYLGVFIRLDQIPAFLNWGQYLCMAKYGLNLFLLIEFNQAHAQTPARALEWEEFLRLNDVVPDLDWMYILLLLVMFIVFRLLALFVLDLHAKRLD